MNECDNDSIYTIIGTGRFKSSVKMIHVDSSSITFYQIVNSLDSEYSYTINIGKEQFLLGAVDYGGGYIAGMMAGDMTLFIILSYKSYNKLYECNVDDLFTV